MSIYNDEYERSIADITTTNDTHAIFLIMMENGDLKKARGRRRMSDRQKAINIAGQFRVDMIMRYASRCQKIIDKVRFITPSKRRRLFKRCELVIDAKSKSFDPDKYWYKNWHRFENETAKLPRIEEFGYNYD